MLASMSYTQYSSHKPHPMTQGEFYVSPGRLDFHIPRATYVGTEKLVDVLGSKVNPLENLRVSSG